MIRLPVNRRPLLSHFVEIGVAQAAEQARRRGFGDLGHGRRRAAGKPGADDSASEHGSGGRQRRRAGFELSHHRVAARHAATRSSGLPRHQEEARLAVDGATPHAGSHPSDGDFGH